MTGYLVGGLIGAALALVLVLVIWIDKRIKALEAASKARLPYDKIETTEDLLAMLNSMTWDKENNIIREQQELDRIRQMWAKAAKVREA